MSPTLHENLSLLIELWLNRVDALLLVGLHDGGPALALQGQAIPLENGALVNVDDWTLLQAHLDRGPIQVVRWAGQGRGNRARMGAILVEACRTTGIDVQAVFEQAESAQGPWQSMLGELHLEELISLASASDESPARATLAGLIDRGLTALSQARWTEAERLFEEALQLRIDAPLALAGLAHARLHSPTRPAEERTKSAWNLALLATQLAPADPEVATWTLAIQRPDGAPARKLSASLYE